MLSRNSFLLWIVTQLFLNEVKGQSVSIQQGVVFRKGTAIRIANAEIINKRSRQKVTSNDFGIFRIASLKNDTLQISRAGYEPKTLIVDNFKDTILYLTPTNLLQEVYIREQSIKKELEEVQHAYRSKGVYYKGKPPLSLLSPFGGHPITFFRELFSKDAKRARRFSKYAEREMAYYEVSARFNDHFIKSITPIKDDELADFKSAYWPTLEQIKRWNDYDLINYIKKSYQEFKNRNKEE